MAVATPVIERNTFAQQTKEREAAAGMTADELHNARMKDDLARLLNPEYKITDVVALKTPVHTPTSSGPTVP